MDGGPENHLGPTRPLLPPFVSAASGVGEAALSEAAMVAMATLRRFALPLLAVRPRAPALRMLSTRVTMPPGCTFNTPLLESAPLSELVGTRVLLKMDALQPSGSFKDRGMAYLCAELKQRGATSLISSSGGNAGHAIAVVGRKLGMRVRVIVPQTTKPIMLTKIRAQGAEVTVHGANWNEADELARELVAADSAAEYVSPYDDPLLWRGLG